MKLSCTNLPLSVFIACICDQDYSSLSGDPAQAAAAWQVIYEEYLELSGSQRENEAFQLQGEINRLFYRHFVLTEILDILRKYVVGEAIELLNKEGFPVVYNEDDLPAYHKQLDRIIARCKAMEIDLKEKQHRLDQLSKIEQKGQKIDRIYFDRNLATLSKYSGYRINENEETVSRYVAICNILKAESEKVQHGRRQDK